MMLTSLILSAVLLAQAGPDGVLVTMYSDGCPPCKSEADWIEAKAARGELECIWPLTVNLSEGASQIGWQRVTGPNANMQTPQTMFFRRVGGTVVGFDPEAINRLLATPKTAECCPVVIPSLVPWPVGEGTEGRSPDWPALRLRWLAVEPCCQACGRVDQLQVHHILPVEYFPEKELDATNLITLCPRCHWMLGHLGDWTKYNPCMRQDAARHLAEVRLAPRSAKQRKAFEVRFSNAH
jgi:hypothetical protein